VRKVTILLVALTLSACNQAVPAASTVSAPNTVSCRLPISISQPQAGPKGAFIDYPSGNVTIDPSGGGAYYDRQFSRWLPVQANSVSTDGSHYAYGGATDIDKPILHIVEVVSGADRIYSLPPELFSAIGGLFVFEYVNDAVYLGVAGEGYVQALWSFDIATGVTKNIAAISEIGAIDEKIVWLGTLKAGDPNAWSWVPGSPTNQIERLDLRDGTMQIWLYRPGHLLDVIGIDAAHNPIVRDYTDKQTVELLTLSSATAHRAILKGSVETWLGYISGMAADSHGVWFGGDKGIYLYSEAGGLKKVTDHAGIPAGTCA
jgi:hypothetical protein